MKKLFSIIVSLIIFFIFFYIVDWKIVTTNINSANTKHLVLGILMSFFWPIFGFFRWKFILNAFDHSSLNTDILKSVLISYCANLMIPGKGGDFSKAYTISRNQRSKFILPVIIERFGDVFILVLISIVGSIYLNETKFLLLSLFILLLMIILTNSTNLWD